jgi:hypothetical protein
MARRHIANDTDQAVGQPGLGLRSLGGATRTAEEVSRCDCRWTDSTYCAANPSGDHACWRTSPGHRTHICDCTAFQCPAARAAAA